MVDVPLDPLHQPGSPQTFWTTTNAEENLPGVTDPLSGTFWSGPVSVGTLGAFADMGVVAERDVVEADDPDACITSLICGRYCVNISLVRRLADCTPGTSGDAMERDLFGAARPGIPSQRDLRRYPVVLAKAPLAAALVAPRLNRLRGPSQRWWHRSIAQLDGADDATARAKFAEAVVHMTAMMRPHTLGTMLVQGVLEQVRALSELAGVPGAELELSRGLGGLEEVTLVSQLWEVAHGGRTVDAFVSDFGFHGPGASALSARSWREDPTMLDGVLASYREMGEDRSPAAGARAAAEGRRVATKALMAGLPASRRPGAKVLLAYGDRLWALRETGKATYLHAIDVARIASRILGRSMVARGQIVDPADIAFLTAAELLADDGRRGWTEEVAFRRERRDHYASFDVPQTWTGVPNPVVPDAANADDAAPRVTGLGASPGVAEGIARVVLDPTVADLDDGEILVCKTTDPSWGALFVVAAAAVIDVGALSSHGAIVARELAIPCVIGTRNGTAIIRDGDRVRVDGDAGVVEVLGRG